ncbi:hypothetical protein K3217_27700 [bacterium BD-1]|uniref:hypothetical protein n=1 Tax=Arenimonas sp. TaxID=1872635 RepID=UPI001E3025DC|nr:hypothetical protein [Ottowia caeni]
MKGLAAGLLLALLADAGLRLHGHVGLEAGAVVPVLGGLHLVAIPGTSAAALGLGPVAWRGVCLAMALMAAASFVFTSALSGRGRGPVFVAGAWLAAGVVALAAADLAELLAFGYLVDTLAWQPGMTGGLVFGLAQALMPVLLVTLAACWAVQLAAGLRQGS